MPTFNGTSGDDILSGTADTDLINGLAGNDWIQGGAGADQINGGDGHDDIYSDQGGDPEEGYFTFHPDFVEFYEPPILDHGSEIDTINAGTGDDFVSIGYGDSADGGTNDNWSSGDILFLSLIMSPTGLTIDFQNTTLTIGGGTITGFEAVNYVEGTQLNDVFTFSAQPFPIAGFGGASGGGTEISAMGGDDRVIAGYYTNNIWGGDGNDFLDGGASQYLLSVDGGDGNDTILGSRLSGVGSQLSGGSGDDAIMGGTGMDLLLGGDGDDQLNGVSGDDSLFGGRGNDILFAGSGVGSNVLDGGEGVDTARYTYGSAVTVDLGRTGPQDVGGGKLHTLIGIENLGGSAFGADNLTGNAGANILTGFGGQDILTGGGGNDTFRDSIEHLNGDTITDFADGDRIVIWDASLAGFSFSLSGNALTYTGGSLTLTGFTGRLVASAAEGGGVQLMSIGDVSNDFNGDGRSDLFWRKADGTFTSWLGQPNGSFVDNPGSGANAVVGWLIVGTGDFNGDGCDDILWRHHNSGEIGQWLGQPNGVFVNNGAAAANAVDKSWSVVGTADYNGDGRDDILWRHTSGEVGQWLGQTNGSFANNGGAAANSVDPSWTVRASGDFNGDGREDVLWRHGNGVFAEWQGTSSGALVNAGPVMAGATGLVVGSGDFNGDGRDDVLMRADSGALTVWLGQANGQFTSFTPTLQLLDRWWKITAISDYNGDGRDDLVWRHELRNEGAEWLGTGTGDFAYNGAIPTVDLSFWPMEAPDIWLV